MDENVMRVLQMLQEGIISAQEAETLIAALRGESAAPAAEAKNAKEAKTDKSFLGNFDFDFERLKPPKIDLNDLGDRISKAVSKVEPEKIVKRLQAQLRTATRTGAHWGASMSQRVRVWTEGEDRRPTKPMGSTERVASSDQEHHLEPGAFVTVENPLGNVLLFGDAEGPARVSIVKTAWTDREEELDAALERIEVAVHATDARLDIKVSVPDFFHHGVVDLELHVPRTANARISTHFGDVTLTGIEGRAEAVTTAGNLKLQNLRGDVRGETVSGDLHLEHIGGSVNVASQSGDIVADDMERGLTANTASGEVRASGLEGGRVECKSVSGDVLVERVGLRNPVDITVESVSGSASLTDANGNISIKAVSGDVSAKSLAATRLQAQTVSGDVRAQLREVFSGTMQISTVSGDVSLGFPEGSNVRVSLNTTAGEMRCDHDAHGVTATDNFWTGQIGTGAGTVNVQTISGEIHVERAIG